MEVEIEFLIDFATKKKKETMFIKPNIAVGLIKRKVAKLVKAKKESK